MTSSNFHSGRAISINTKVTHTGKISYLNNRTLGKKKKRPFYKILLKPVGGGWVGTGQVWSMQQQASCQNFIGDIRKQKRVIKYYRVINCSLEQFIGCSFPLMARIQTNVLAVQKLK